MKVKDSEEALKLIRYGLLHKIHEDGEDLTNAEKEILDICDEILFPQSEKPRTIYESGECCMAEHAKAIPPWTCNCPCHSMSKENEKDIILF